MKAKERMTAHQKMWVQPQIIFSFFILTGYINFLGLEVTLRSTQMFNYNSTYYIRYCRWWNPSLAPEHPCGTFYVE